MLGSCLGGRCGQDVVGPNVSLEAPERLRQRGLGALAGALGRALGSAYRDQGPLVKTSGRLSLVTSCSTWPGALVLPGLAGIELAEARPFEGQVSGRAGREGTWTNGGPGLLQLA